MKDIKEYIVEAVAAAVPEGLPEGIEVETEIPRDPAHGDLATNIAFLLAKHLRQSPRKIAEEICARIEVDSDYTEKAEAAGGGFINFTCSRKYLANELREILKQEADYGKRDIGKGKRVNLEFVSANPTGPLNIVSARSAALGDSLKRIMNFCGYRAESEYYINDAGKQILKLGQSLLARHLESLGFETVEFPENGYQGEYLKEMAADYQPPETINRELKSEEASPERNRYLQRVAGIYAVDKILETQKATLKRYGVEFDYWARESIIRNSQAHLEIRKTLGDKSCLYEKDGALYFRTTEFGDDEDRVIWTSEGEPTYLLPDIAYHQDKFNRGFEWLIDIWGPDHHGYIARMEAALQALGHSKDSFSVIVAQQVNLVRGGERVKMSKRAGEMVTMDELLDEVGVDAARFFFHQRKPSAHLDFDLDLAVKETEENPVFYVQYAHARICSIERLAEEQGIAPAIRFEALQEAEEYDLIRKLMEFPTVVEICGRHLEPVRITVYLQELASAFHSFYQKHRVVSEDRKLSSVRLGLCRGIRIVIRNSLHLLGVRAPQRM